MCQSSLHYYKVVNMINYTGPSCELVNQLADDKHHSRIAIYNAGCVVPSNHSLLSAVKHTNKQTKHEN